MPDSGEGGNEEKKESRERSTRRIRGHVERRIKNAPEVKKNLKHQGQAEEGDESAEGTTDAAEPCRIQLNLI